MTTAPISVSDDRTFEQWMALPEMDERTIEEYAANPVPYEYRYQTYPPVPPRPLTGWLKSFIPSN